MQISRTAKDLFILITVTIVSTLLIWLPHSLQLPSFYNLQFNNGFNTIYQNFDGLEYVIIAKSLYQPSEIAKIAQPLPVEYFPSHFPGYSLAMIPFAEFIGYLKSMLVVSLIFTILSVIGFYFLVRDFKLTSHPLWLSIVFLFLPARWLITHSVGSPEPMFAFFTIMTIYFFLKFENLREFRFIFLTAIFASLAQLTRPPGILIFIALGLFALLRFISEIKITNVSRMISSYAAYLTLLLIPLTLMGLFYWFYSTTGDFWAYFHTGDNIHLGFPPFQVFNKSQFWVGDIWLEDLIYIFLLGYLAGIKLLKGTLAPVGVFILTFMTATALVAHRDISRYALPVAPFVLIAFEKVVGTKEFKIAFVVIVLAIYLYSQNYIIHNTAPINNLLDYN